MARGFIFLALIQCSVTQSPYQIIKQANLLSLRTNDSLAKSRLILLSSGVGG